MKRLSDLRGTTPPSLTEDDDNLAEALRSEYTTKLRQLSKLGIIPDDKFQVLIRAFGKSDVGDMSRSEREVLISAFDSLMHFVLDNKQIFQKVKQQGASSSKHEELFNEAFRPKTQAELGYDNGEYEDVVHDRLEKAGYKKTGDGQYRHKDSGKEVVVIRHDGKVHHTIVSEDSEEIDESKTSSKVKKAFPVLILLRRKAIRLFPDGKKVGLYYSDKLDRYISIPSTGDAVSEEAVSEDKTITEVKTSFAPSPAGDHATDVISHLKGIVANRQPGHVHFKNGSKMKVDMLTAHALLTTYDRLSHPENKVHFDRHVNRDNPSFLKMVDFAHRHYIGDAASAGMSAPSSAAKSTSNKPKSAVSTVKKSIKNK